MNDRNQDSLVTRIYFIKVKPTMDFSQSAWVIFLHKSRPGGVAALQDQVAIKNCDPHRHLIEEDA